jgi:hypothetical protein
MVEYFVCLRKFYIGTSIVLQTSHFTETKPKPKHIWYFLKYLPSRQIIRKKSESLKNLYFVQGYGIFTAENENEYLLLKMKMKMNIYYWKWKWKWKLIFTVENENFLGKFSVKSLIYNLLSALWYRLKYMKKERCHRAIFYSSFFKLINSKHIICQFNTQAIILPSGVLINTYSKILNHCFLITVCKADQKRHNNSSKLLQWSNVPCGKCVNPTRN